MKTKGKRHWTGGGPCAGAGVAFVAAGLLLCEAAGAQISNKTNSPAETIQQQIDALRQGQERVLKELDEIKQLLHENAGRSETAARPPGPSAISVNITGEPYKGDIRAHVAIIEYSDFDCTFCGTYAREIYPLLDRDYVQSGKIKYYFRDLPSPEHTNAVFKARLARCAGEQGKFWEMHDCLFTNQAATTWEQLAPLARSVGIDADLLQQCLATPKYTQNIRRSVASADKLHINGTPAFIIGTVSEDGGFLRSTNLLIGAEPYASLKAILDPLVAAPPPTASKGR